MGGNILGNTDSVRAMNRATIEGFVARHYHPNEMVFSVVGATPWSKVKRLCEKHFGWFRADLPFSIVLRLKAVHRSMSA